MADPASIKANLRSAFRDYEVDGVPSSGAYDPAKAPIRVSLDGVVDYIAEVATSVGAGVAGYATIGDMPTLTNDDIGRLARVDGGNVYRWAGAAEGGWVVFDDPVIVAADSASNSADDADAARLAAEAAAADALAVGVGLEADEYLDTPEEIVRRVTDDDDNVIMDFYRSGAVDFLAGPRLREQLGEGADYTGLTVNLDPDTIQTARAIDADLTRVWSDQDGMLRRYELRTDDEALKTALMAGAAITALIGYGQSNNEGNSNGVVINGAATYPGRVLMLSSGVRGTGNADSNASAIPDFLPAVEAVNGMLGETPLTSMANSLARLDGYTDRKLYIPRVPAKGGFTVLELAPGSIPYTNMIEEVQRIVALAQLGEPERIDVVLTQIEGETDATGDPAGVGNGTPYATFVTRQNAILNSALSDIEAIPGVDSVIWIINQAGTNTSSSYVYGNLPAAAQYDIAMADTTGQVFLGEPHWQFETFDNFHTTAASKAILGELNARTLGLIREGKPHAVSVSSVTIVGAAIEVLFDLPEGVELELLTLTNLVQRGFRLHSVPFDPATPDAGTNIAINTVALADVEGVARKVVLTPASAPVAGQELRYAFKDNNSTGGAYYGARGGVATTTTDFAQLDGRPLRFMAPCFRKILA